MIADDLSGKSHRTLLYVSLSFLLAIFVLARIGHGSHLLSFTFYPLIIFSAVSIWLLSHNTNNNQWVFLHLAVFHVVLSGLYLIPQYGFFGWDTLVTYDIVATVLQGDVPATVAIPTPLFHIYIGVVQNVLGIPIGIAVKYVPLGTSVIGILALSIFIYQRFSYQHAVLGGLFVSSVWFPTAFHAMATKESIAIPFLLIFVVTVHRSYWDKRYLPLAFVMVFAMIFTHHMSTAFLVSIAGIIVLSDWIAKLNLASLQSGDLDTNIPSYSLIIFVFVAIVISLHWLYLYRTPIFGVLSLLTEYKLLPDGTRAVSNEPFFKFTSVRAAIQLLWRGGLMHFPGFAVVSGQVLATGGLILAVIFAQVKKQGFFALFKRVRSNEIVLISLGSTLFLIIIAGVAFTTGLLGAQRIVGYSWIFVVPFLFGLLSWEKSRRWIQIAILAIVVVNLLTYPVHVLAPTMQPNYSSGELGFGYEKSDYATVEWLGVYGTHAVASDVKYMRLWRGYDVNEYPNSELPWLINESYERPSSTYVYKSAMYDDFLLTRSGWTRHPIELGTHEGTARVYDNGGVIYLTADNKITVQTSV